MRHDAAGAFQGHGPSAPDGRRRFDGNASQSGGVAPPPSRQMWNPGTASGLEVRAARSGVSTAGRPVKAEKSRRT